MSFFDIDIQTAFRLRAIADIAVACLFLVYRNKEDVRHPIRLFIGGQLINAIGMTLISERGSIPLFLSAHVGNVLFYVGVALVMLAFAVISHTDRQLRAPLTIVAAIGLIAFVGWDFVFPAPEGSPFRYVAVSSLVVGCLYSLGAAGVLRSRHRSPLRKVLGAGFSALALCFFARTYASLAHGMTVFTPSVLQSLTVLMMLLATIIGGVGFVLLAHEESDQAIRIAATTDPLTGLANRRRFDEVLRSEYLRLKRSGAPLSVIMIDIDHFKRYNDRYGHPQGDECLRRVSAAIGKTVYRTSDLAARFGGEEFVVVIPETDAAGAHTVAENIRQAIGALSIAHKENTAAAHVTASLGVATRLAAELDSPEAIISLADAALYRAKQHGRNRTEVMPRQDDEIVHKSQLVRLVWHDIAASGNPRLDDEHKALFDQANVLLTSGMREQPKGEIEVLVRDTVDMVRTHFSNEEALLRNTSYPGTAHHIERHKELLTKARDISTRFSRDEVDVGDLFGFLAYDVVAHHILREDREFFPYLPELALSNAAHLPPEAV